MGLGSVRSQWNSLWDERRTMWCRAMLRRAGEMVDSSSDVPRLIQQPNGRTTLDWWCTSCQVHQLCRGICWWCYDRRGISRSDIQSSVGNQGRSSQGRLEWLCLLFWKFRTISRWQVVARHLWYQICPSPSRNASSKCRDQQAARSYFSWNDPSHERWYWSDRSLRQLGGYRS